jgi:hypothetical protein
VWLSPRPVLADAGSPRGGGPSDRSGSRKRQRPGRRAQRRALPPEGPAGSRPLPASPSYRRRPTGRYKGLHHRPGAQDGDHPLHVVGQHVQAHLRADPVQGAGEEVGGSYPGLNGAEGVLRRPPPHPHGIRPLVQPALHRIEDALVLPARDAALPAGRAPGLDGAIRAPCRPVVPQELAGLVDAVEPPPHGLAGRAAVGVLLGQVDGVLLAETPVGLGARGHRLGHERGDAGPLAGEDLLAVEVAPVGQDGQRPVAHGVPRMLRHPRQLGAVVADIGHLVRHDQVVPGVDGGLRVVADDPRALAARRRRAGVRVGERDLPVRRGADRGPISRRHPIRRARPASLSLSRPVLARAVSSSRRSAVSSAAR